MNDFSIEIDGDTSTIQIIDNYFQIQDNEFEIFKTFLFDFVSEAMKKHSKQGYLHSNNIDEILKKYE